MVRSLQPPRSRLALPDLGDERPAPPPPPGPPGRPRRPGPEATPRWRWIAAGIAAAWLGSFVLPGMFAWVLCAIPHEMGHSTVGCLLGRPSTPAISLAGEAWSGVGERRTWLVVAIAVIALAGAVLCARRRRPIAAAAAGAAALLLPLLALSRAADALITLGGHAGELLFAAYCFSLAWTGGRTDTPLERTGSAMAGAIVQAANLRLCFGIATSAAARADYRANTSLGIKNDYLVLAEDLWHCRVETVAMVMLLLALLPLPLGLLLGWWRQRSG